MKKLVLVAAVAALSACSQESEDAAGTAAMEGSEPTEAVATEQGPAGIYDVQRYNGGTSTIVIDADGTYTDTGPGGTETGTFALKEGDYCFDPEGDLGEVCWKVGEPDADGTFTASDPEGHTVTVTRRAETAAPAAAEAATT